MYSLGISACAHESSAALLHNGEVIAHAEEERFNRERHTSAFPENSIRFCLRQAGISLQEVGEISFFWRPYREISGNLGHFLKFFPGTLNLLGAPGGEAQLGFFQRVRAMRGIGRELKRRFSLPSLPAINFVEHHLAHAASTYFASDFSESAILTLDGRGESTTCLFAHGRGTTIQKIQEIAVPHSLGHLYAAVTSHLGFRPFFDEWKVMGLSAYGSGRLANSFEDLVELEAGGKFNLNLDYFSFHTHGQKEWVSDKFRAKFGPARAPTGEITQQHRDLAAALQATVERAGVHLAKHLYSVTESENLCVAGGVALNCLMNRKIMEETKFENFFFQPLANDAGASLGAAMHTYYHSGHRLRAPKMETIYLGPEYTDAEIESALNAANLNYKRASNVESVAGRLLADGKIIGWFQGRMESGPRALGNRSILANAAGAEMKAKINALVKKRESFRPFAPSVTEEAMHTYFSLPRGKAAPHMMVTAEVKQEIKNLLPAITHVDGTARVQTVSPSQNPRFWRLLTEFGKLTGIPVLLNTSFNENEPIVCTPREAIDCFNRARLDALVIGDYVVLEPASNEHT